MKGIVLYGPPAAGKDTTAEALCRLSELLRRYQRMKVGSGRTANYRMASLKDLDALRQRNDVVWENTRYGAVYVIDRSTLANIMTQWVPIIELGQPEAIDALRAAFPGTTWLVVELWCDLATARRRLEARQSGDATQRVQAWFETKRLKAADLRFDTGDSLEPESIARTIIETLRDAIRETSH